MSANEIELIAIGFVGGGIIGFGWAQAIYSKMLAELRGYCAEYRAMLDARR